MSKTSDHVPLTAEQLYREGTDPQFAGPAIQLGPWASFTLINDPRHLAFSLSRYKFVAKMLEGKPTVMEVGSGDGLGLPIVAQVAQQVICVDWDQRLLEGNASRFPHLTNVSYRHADFNQAAPALTVDAAYWIDVIEHLDPKNEAHFVDNLVSCLRPDGILITGTPNITANAFASTGSRIQHINLKSAASLRALMLERFDNVFSFGMNDEVVHTGFAPMCHYLWTVAAGVRKSRR